MSTPEKLLPAKVWILTVRHSHGSDCWAAATEALALQQLREYVDEWWEHEKAAWTSGKPPRRPRNADTRVTKYFEELAPDETFAIEETEVRLK